MLKQTLQLFAFLLIATASHAQVNMNLLGNLDYASNRGDCSDIWGYVDGSGNEYAIVGNETGTSIVDVTNPSNPVEVFYTPGANTIWRDMKVWNQTAYITNEGGNGLKIIDLSNLPGPITSADVSQYTGSTYPFTTAHNIFMDENGHAYICGSNNGNGGAIILDVSVDPLNPIELGRYNDFYMHDIFVRGDTLWGGAINDGFFVVVDVSDPTNCTTMATHFTPTTFSHNVWLSDDGNTLFTTDEVSNAYVAAYDVSNINSISELDRVQSSPGQNVIPHNTFVFGDYIITSYYRDGVTIHDASDPSNLIQVGNYDTSPQFSGDGFNGCWGVYPYLPSGNIIASDIENGLFILGATYTPAAFLTGVVTDASTTNPISGATVQVLTTTSSDNTDAAGAYGTGMANGGTFDVSFSKVGYASQTINNVVLTNGNTTVLDVALVPLATFTLTATVLDENSNPINNAQVFISDSQSSFNITTNGAGEFSLNSFLDGTYDVTIGNWGNLTLCLANQDFNSNGGPYVFEMEAGYSDYFDVDLGWSESGNATTGAWERGLPVGTSYQGQDANPGADSQDCGNMAYVTGNGGGQSGDDDIDGGQTILTSPVFDLSGYLDPHISFDRWFFNDGGTGTPNDSLVIELSNGTQTVQIDFADQNDPNESSWYTIEFRVEDLIATSAFMQLKVRSMDLTPGHLVEAGFDNFVVTDDLSSLGTEVLAMNEAIDLYPVPCREALNIRLNGLEESYETIRVEIVDVSSGKIISQESFASANLLKLKNEFASGMYFVRIFGDDVLLSNRSIVKL